MFIHLFFNSIFLKEKQALQNEVKRLEMEVKRNLQTQNDASAGTKNQTPSGRVVMASKPPQSEKPVGNLKSSNPLDTSPLKVVFPEKKDLITLSSVVSQK